MLAIASPDFHLTSAAKYRRPRSGGLKEHANIKMMQWMDPSTTERGSESGPEGGKYKHGPLSAQIAMLRKFYCLAPNKRCSHSGINCAMVGHKAAIMGTRLITISAD